MTTEDVGRNVLVKFGDSLSNFSRVIRLAHFVAKKTMTDPVAAEALCPFNVEGPGVKRSPPIGWTKQSSAQVILKIDADIHRLRLFCSLLCSTRLGPTSSSRPEAAGDVIRDLGLVLEDVGHDFRLLLYVKRFLR